MAKKNTDATVQGPPVSRRIVEVYTDSKGKYRWRLLSASNKNIMADSGQGYSTRFGAKTAVERVFDGTYPVIKNV